MEPSYNYNQLAAAVITQALTDLAKVTYYLKKRRIPLIRAEARAFLLTPNDDLQFWCDLANIHMDGVIRKAHDIVRVWDTTGTVILHLPEDL